MKSADVWFRAVLCLSTALMMTISWPLWVTAGEFPRVPWFGWVRLLPLWASWIRFVVALIAMVITGIWPLLRSTTRLQRWFLCRDSETPPTEEKIPQVALGFALLLSSWMVLEDQFRLQPWMYQFLLLGFAVFACSGVHALTLCRIFVIALYLHSGLSKLDQRFVNGIGRDLLYFGLRLIHLESQPWSVRTLDILVLLMPSWEIAIASLLTFRWRRVGVVAATIQHLALLAILGPWGLNHSANVLIWNVTLIAEDFLLFWSPSRNAAEPALTSRTSKVATIFAATLIVLASVLPLIERLGWWDTWPSFGLYSAPRATVYIRVHDRTRIIGGIKQKASREINLAAWSLKERRVPLYPSARAINGAAEALARHYGTAVETEIYVYVGEPPEAHRFPEPGRLHGPWKEGGDVFHYIGVNQIRQHGDTFWLNAHPAR